MDYRMDFCGGCLTCEIACSYKHTGEFNHLISSIEIIELEGKPGYKVRIHENNTGDRIICDGCIDIDGEPMCVRYCHKSQDLNTIISEFRALHSLEQKK
ncbi:MAG: hypothetical protein ACOWWR_12505 [Eubacteriales bacterium]